MIRKLLIPVLSIFSFASLVSPAYAATVNTCPGGDFASLCTWNFNSVPNIISSVITLVLIGAVVIAIFFLLLGGIRWITSGGDKTKVDEARKQIVAAIIGLVIAFLAFFIIRVVGGILNVNVSNLNLPPINAQ